MFQTSIILFLQSFSSEFLDAIFNVITMLGDDKLMAGILILVTFGLDFRKGVLLMQFFQWTKIITDGLKYAFKMPRPTYVHGAIEDLQHHEFETTPFFSPGAGSFFGFLDGKVISTFRGLNIPDYGFPSGHASQSTVFWGGIAMLFNKRYLYFIAILISLLVALSRIYLGRHFVGDVCFGLLIAGVVLTVVWQVTSCSDFFEWLFSITSYKLSNSLPVILTWFYNYFLPLGLVILAPQIFGDGAGYLIGVNASLPVINQKGLPSDRGSILQRTLRVLLGTGLYFATERTVKGLFDLFHLDDIVFFDGFLASAIPTFVCFAGCILLGYKLKLYERQEGKLGPSIL